MNLGDQPCKLDRNKVAKQQILAKLREINGTERHLKDGHNPPPPIECRPEPPLPPPSKGCSIEDIGAGLVAMNELGNMYGPVNAVPHEFVGRQDQGCGTCGKPDRHWIHAKASAEMMNRITVADAAFEGEVGKEKYKEPLADDEVEFELKFPDGTKKTLRAKKKDFDCIILGLKQECLDEANDAT